MLQMITFICIKVSALMKCLRQVLCYHPSSTHRDKHKHTLRDILSQVRAGITKNERDSQMSIHCKMLQQQPHILTACVAAGSVKKTRYLSPMRKEEY